MQRVPYAAVALLLLAGYASTEEHNRTTTDTETEVYADSCDVQDSCALHDEAGPWSALLQEWAITASDHHGRHGRIMALPLAQGYYVSDRIDGPMLAPPPHPGHQYSQPNYPGRPLSSAAGRPLPSPPSLPLSPSPYDEWQQKPPPPPSTGKIVNRPPNPYKDKFKPSYPAPAQNQPIPVHGPSLPSTDRVDENRPSPQKQVSETDLYLLSAIEKLVYRADLMEKRLRKMEETVHYLVAGVDTKPEPCAENFTRVGGGCYHVSSDAANWKGAAYACRRLAGNMLELDTEQERRKLSSALLADKRLKGGDFWTGGLNPGLLWIWSHSARPVVSNSTDTATNGTQPHAHSATVVGEGRCLAWAHDPATGRYVYRGQDCALRRRYICETDDQAKLSNEIERVARHMRHGRKPKIIWTDDEP